MNFALYLVLQEAFEFINEPIVEAVLDKDYYINPQTKKRYTKDKSNLWSRLQLVYDNETAKGTPDEQLWVSFTELPRLGLNPTKANYEGKSTPSGVFGYPLSYVLDKRSDVPTFTDRPYVIVFKSTEKPYDVGGRYTTPEIEDLKSLTKTQAPNKVAEEKIKKFRLRAEDFIRKHFEDEDQNAFNYITALREMIKLATEDVPDVRELDDDAIVAMAGKGYSAFIDRQRDIISNSLNYQEVGYDLSQLLGGDEAVSPYNRLWVGVETQDGVSALVSQEVKAAIKAKAAELAEGEYKDILQYVNSPRPQRLNLDQIMHFMQLIGKKDVYYIDNPAKMLKLTEHPGAANLYHKALISALKYAKKHVTSHFADMVPLEKREFPGKQELTKIADELGLDINDAIKKALKGEMTGGSESGEVRTNDQLVYRTAQQLARLWAQKDRKPTHWPVRWNKILRRLGHSSAADLKDTGAIHTAEPTQGVFLNPRTIRVLDIIPNAKYMRPDMRPGHWDSGEKKHDHKGYQSQRQSFAYTMTHYDLNNDPQNIARQAVEKKVKWAFNGLANMTSYQLDSAGQHFDILRRGLRIATALERQGVSATGILNNFRTYANFLSRMKISDPEVRKKHGSLVELMRKLMPDAFPQEAPSAVPTPQIGANDVW